MDNPNNPQNNNDLKAVLGELQLLKSQLSSQQEDMNTLRHENQAMKTKLEQNTHEAGLAQQMAQLEKALHAFNTTSADGPKTVAPPVSSPTPKEKPLTPSSPPQPVQQGRPIPPQQTSQPQPVQQGRPIPPQQTSQPQPMQQGRPVPPQQTSQPQPVQQGRPVPPQQTSQPQPVQQGRPIPPQQNGQPQPMQQPASFQAPQWAQSPNPSYGVPNTTGTVPSTPAPVPKQRNLEEFLGGKVANIIGITFVLIGIVIALFYTYAIVSNNYIKAGIAYFVGLLFLGVGEFFNRKKTASFFSLGLCAGGIAIMFATTGVSYFSLGVFNSLGAMLACGVLFLLSLFLASRYKSQVIGIFAVIGGYLPIMALLLDSTATIAVTALIISMAYFLLINMLVLILARKNNWNIIKYFSILCNILCIGFFIRAHQDTQPILLGAYVIVNFLLYLVMITIRPLQQKENLSIHDIVLLVINTVASFTFLLILGIMANWLIATIFAVLFLAIHFIWQRRVPNDIGGQLLFLATGISFVIIAPLVSLNQDYLSNIWMILGMSILTVAIVKEHKYYKAAGIVLTTLGILAFYTNFIIKSFIRFSLSAGDIYIQFALLVLGLLAIAWAIGYSNKEKADFWQSPKSSTIELFLAYVVFTVWTFINHSISFGFSHLTGETEYWHGLLSIAVTFVLLTILPHLPFFYSKIMKVLTRCIFLFTLNFLILGVNIEGIFCFTEPSGMIHALVGITQLAINSFAVFLIYQWAKEIAGDNPNRRAWPPMALSLSSLVLTLILTIYQVTTGVQSTLLTAVLLLWALGMIIYGFVRNIKSMRFSGLALAAVAIVKIIFFDLSFLETWIKAIMYVMAGLLLLGISFAYQHFSKVFLPLEEKPAELNQVVPPPTGGFVPNQEIGESTPTYHPPTGGNAPTTENPSSMAPPTAPPSNN